MAAVLLYRCANCLECTVERNFDTSHVLTRCPECTAFGRFINQVIFDQYDEYEASPPDSLDWARLDRREKLLVAERIARTDRTIENFSITELNE